MREPVLDMLQGAVVRRVMEDLGGASSGWLCLGPRALSPEPLPQPESRGSAAPLFVCVCSSSFSVVAENNFL